MSRYLMLTAAILVTIIALMGYALQRSYKTNGRLAADLVAEQDAREALQEASKKLQATLTLREDLRTAQGLRAASQRHSLEVALPAATDWADERLPQGIADALQ